MRWGSSQILQLYWNAHPMENVANRARASSNSLMNGELRSFRKLSLFSPQFIGDVLSTYVTMFMLCNRSTDQLFPIYCPSKEKGCCLFCFSWSTELVFSWAANAIFSFCYASWYTTMMMTSRREVFAVKKLGAWLSSYKTIHNKWRWKFRTITYHTSSKL